MTIDDVGSAEHSAEYEDSVDGKQSKRGRLKDALSRTKTKLGKVKEEREARKHKQEQEKPNSKLDDDVNDFLSAGRSSFASSQRPSVGSDLRPSVEPSPASPRPSTSESQTHPSPRRVLPISVPRIDVSASSRFPNAKDVNPDALVPQLGSSTISSGSLQSGSLLKPEYKSRSQSAISIASTDRKARIRGLSVGFADVPPVIIGEGGDEAEAPPMEISRAKSRARSASPQGRRPYTNATVQPEARKQMPARGISDNSATAFAPKPITPLQIATSLEGTATRHAPRGPHDDELLPMSFPRMQPGAATGGNATSPAPRGPLETQFVPKPFARTQTGASVESSSSRSTTKGSYEDEFVPKPFARAQTGFSDGGSPHPIHRQPSIPVQPKAQDFTPLQLAGVQTSAMDLTKEFEITLGLGLPVNGSPASNKSPGDEAQIWQPKPKRAPPSYDIIEGGGKRHELNDRTASPPPGSYPQNQREQQPLQHQQSQGVELPQQQQNPENSQRRPAPQLQPLAPQQANPPPQKSPRPEMQPQTQRLQQNSMQLPGLDPTHINAQPAPQRSPQPNVRPLPQRSPQPGPPSAQDYYPPPPQRTATQTARIPQKLERISPKSLRQAYNDQQESGVVRDNSSTSATNAHTKLQLSLDTDNDEYRSFADRQKKNGGVDPFGTPTTARDSPQSSTVRQVMPSHTYTNSPSNYSGSLQNTPQTAQGEPTPNKLRFYESINKGNAPEGFL